MPNGHELKYRNPPNPPWTNRGEGGFISLSALRSRNSKGFTLIEIVITIVIVGILASIAALIIIQGVNSYAAEQSRSGVHYQAELAMERMSREIRQIRSASVTDIQAMTATDLKFTNVNGATVEFTWSNPNLNLSTDKLASGVTVFTFTYYLADGTTQTSDKTQLWFVGINMTAQQGTETLQMASRVHPMNFY